jgi:4-hydroxy-tetrahydrodipicolinate reductase
MLNVQLAQWMNKLEQYDVEVEEIHHVKKIDAPSGTAITTAQLIIENLKRKNSWTMNNVPAQNEIKVIAKREGDVAGIHKVSYDSPEDVIQIIHQAKNRKGLAKGALKAAVWLTENPGVYEFKDVFLDILK